MCCLLAQPSSFSIQAYNRRRRSTSVELWLLSVDRVLINRSTVGAKSLFEQRPGIESRICAAVERPDRHGGDELIKYDTHLGKVAGISVDRLGSSCILDGKLNRVR